jgi:putative mRNA 3-end processing factor
MARHLLEFTDKGIYCEAGDFYIDPWKKVSKAVITHAHADHSRWGMEQYIAHNHSVPIMRLRLGANIAVTGYDYNETFMVNGVKLSFHPAGHIIGSSQVRVEYKGEIWVASGDYKLADDNFSAPFEPVQCHTFITESTFGLPVYRWKPSKVIYNEMNAWWQQNQAEGKVSVLAGYSLGKAQRMLQNIDASIGPIYTHGAVENVNAVLRHYQDLPETKPVSAAKNKSELAGSLVICPPSALNTPWEKKLGDTDTAMASGWMGLRGARRRQSVDRGFVLSDHADWDDLNNAIKATGCEQVFVTHGYTNLFAKWLREQGYDAHEAVTDYIGEAADNDIAEETTTVVESEEEGKQ